MTDFELLEILDRMERCGQTAKDVGKVMGISRSAVLGHRFRINKQLEGIPDVCEKPENMDGGMPPRWWDQ